MRAVVPIIALALCLGAGVAEATGGDSCAAATDLATIMTTCDGTPFEDSALAMDTATASGGPTPSCFNPSSALNNDRWYTWTNATGSTQQLVVTTDGAPNPTTGDSEIGIFDDCSGTTQLGCDQDGGDFGSGWLSTVSYDVAAGETVQIVFDGYAGDDSFTSAWFSCSAPPAPPANDDPSGAIALTVGQDFAAEAIVGTNVAATASEVADPSIPAPGCADYSGGDVWYTAQVTANGSLTLETNSNSDGIGDMGIAVYSGTIGALTLVECDDDDSPDGLFSLVAVTGRTPGETLYLRAWEYGNDVVGTFQVSAWDVTVPVELQSFSIE
jgi:hypothetical protein